MTRVLQPELLDELPATDPRAIHSRRDLRRLNALMGNAVIIGAFVAAYARKFRSGSKLRMAEIGCGDGNIAVGVACALQKIGFAGEFLLVDRAPVVATDDSWPAQVIQADIFEWLESAPAVDVIIANLFLHHFEDDALQRMLRACAERCSCFAAAEPRRSNFAAWFARRVGLIGCNEVTRHDAVISVRAGFDGAELSTLWPKDAAWLLTEKRAGLFSHFFGATRAI